MRKTTAYHSAVICLPTILYAPSSSPHPYETSTKDPLTYKVSERGCLRFERGFQICKACFLEALKILWLQLWALGLKNIIDRFSPKIVMSPFLGQLFLHPYTNLRPRTMHVDLWL